MKMLKISLVGVIVGIGLLGSSIEAEAKGGVNPEEKAIGVISKEVVSLKNPDGSMEIYGVDELLEYGEENSEGLRRHEREIIERVEKNSGNRGED